MAVTLPTEVLQDDIAVSLARATAVANKHHILVIEEGRIAERVFAVLFYICVNSKVNACFNRLH